MNLNLNESHVEEPALNWFRRSGYVIGPAQPDHEGNLHVCMEGNPQTHE